MLENLEGSFAERTAADGRLRRFVSDASHELRNPLASIRGYADLYLTGAATDQPAVVKAMTRMSRESGRMGAIVDDLLLLARLDQGRAIDRQPVAVDALVADAADDARAVEPDRPVSVAVGDGPFVVLGDEHKLRQAVGNLLANVRMHTSAGTPVVVGVVNQGDDIRLWVSDQGGGMDADAASTYSTGSIAPILPGAGRPEAPGSGCRSWPRWSPPTAVASQSTVRPGWAPPSPCCCPSPPRRRGPLSPPWPPRPAPGGATDASVVSRRRPRAASASARASGAAAVTPGLG